MKKSLNTLFFIFLFIGILKNSSAQVMKTDKEIFSVEGAYNFIILKKDIKTQKVLAKIETKIPDKSQKEMFYPGSNFANFELIGENIVIVYDVWQKETGTKDCSIKTLNIKTNKFSQAKLVYSTKVNSVYSSGEIIYKPVYSPDKTKLAILKDNISPSYDIDPEITIYDTKSFSTLSTKKLSSKYEGQKRVINQNLTMDNEGNIALTFSLLNEKTKMTTKTYSADIPFKENDMKNIKEGEGATSNEGGVDQKAHGNFYKSLQDYVDNKPIKGTRMKNGSFSWSVIKGTDYKLIDDDGNIKKEDAKNLPGELFTYKKDNFSTPMLMRLIDDKPYIVLVAGKMCYYSLYLEQENRYYAEGWDGKLMKFKEKDFEDYLDKYNLLGDYKKDKPKREMKDDVNGYFNKIINWQIKYFELLNTKM
ncbi:hypothetical protein BH10BAC1_BH10BAC1_04200 [soil metagenome]